MAALSGSSLRTYRLQPIYVDGRLVDFINQLQTAKKKYSEQGFTNLRLETHIEYGWSDQIDSATYLYGDRP